MNNCKPLCIIGLTLYLISGVFSIVYSIPMVTLPIRFHIVSGLIMTKNGQTMDSWVTAGDITKTLVPEINRIWQTAGITFTVEKVEAEGYATYLAGADPPSTTVTW